MFLDEIFPTPIWGFDNMNLDVDSIKFWAYEEKKKDEEHYHTIWTFQKTSLAA